MTLNKGTALAAAVAAAVLLPWLVRLHAGDEQKKDKGQQEPGRKEALEQIRKAVSAIQEKLEDQEARYQEFRQEHPLLDISGKPERRLEAIQAARDKFNVRLMEINGQLQILEEAQKAKVDPQASLLLIKRLLGASTSLAHHGESKEITPADVIKYYTDSLQLEKKYIALQARKLDQQFDQEQDQLREVLQYLNQDKHQRAEIERTRQMFEPLMRRYEEFRLELYVNESQKKKGK